MRHKDQINLILDFIEKGLKNEANNFYYLDLNIIEKNRK